MDYSVQQEKCWRWKRKVMQR